MIILVNYNRNILKETLRMVMFPVDAIKKNHVIGLENCDCEVYLLELLNKSEQMRKLANGLEFVAEKNQSNGQCDARAGNYELDFKLLISCSAMEALSGTSYQETYKNGVICFSQAPQPDRVFKVGVLHRELQMYDSDQLRRIMNGPKSSKESENYLIEKDVMIFLRTMQKNKNLFFLFPYELLFETNNVCEQERVVFFEELLAETFGMAFDVVKQRKKYDTYLAFVYKQYFLIFKYRDNSFVYWDKVSIEEIYEFKRLATIDLSVFLNRNFLKTFSSIKEFEEEWARI